MKDWRESTETPSKLEARRMIKKKPFGLDRSASVFAIPVKNVIIGVKLTLTLLCFLPLSAPVHPHPFPHPCM